MPSCLAELSPQTKTLPLKSTAIECFFPQEMNENLGLAFSVALIFNGA